MDISEKNQEGAMADDIIERKEKFMEQFFVLDEPIEESIKEMRDHAVEINNVLAAEMVKMFREKFSSHHVSIDKYCDERYKKYMATFTDVLNYRCEEVAKYLHDNNVFNLNFDGDGDALETKPNEEKPDENEVKKIDESITKLLNKKQECQVLRQNIKEAQALNKTLANLLNV